MFRLLFGCMIFLTTRLRVMRVKKSRLVKKMRRLMRRRKKVLLSQILKSLKMVYMSAVVILW